MSDGTTGSSTPLGCACVARSVWDAGWVTASQTPRNADERVAHLRRQYGSAPSRADARHAEPLRAPWRPDTGSSHRAPGKSPKGSGNGDKQPRGKSKLSGFVRTYGWRAYALPALFAVTVFVGVNMVSTAGDPAEQAAPSDVAGEQGNSAPLAREHPVDPVALDIPTAELPAGGAYTEAGAGTWHIVGGTSEKVGTSPTVLTYTVEVEDGIDPSSYAGDKSFAETVESTLSDPRSWTGSGEVSLKRVDAGGPPPDFRVSLTSPATNHKPGVCGYSIKYEASCYNADLDRVVINLARWVRGAMAFNGDLGLYRQYVINHEVGHALGNGHTACPEDGALAPVMMQQTFGVANDYVAKLNGTAHSEAGVVPSNGKVCRPNAWPNPTARPPN